ncbi:MAG: DUF1858 domain-containing protein [Isosphaeraceae bacterium]
MATDIDRGSELSLEIMVPDLLRDHPGARAVLDRHGLRGCGGPQGPYESLRVFARTHGINEADLLKELGQADQSSAVVEASGSPPKPRYVHTPSGTIYRRFFIAAIVVTLTAGATWGAWMLWMIGRAGTFREASLHQINAHGEAQIYGWVGLFIMGFAYQAFPRFWGTTLAAPWLAAWSFVLMLGGLVVRTCGMVAAGAWSFAPWLALAGGLLEIAAVCCFVTQIVVTFRRSGQRLEPMAGFIMTALACFLASILMSVWHTWTTMTTAGDALVWYISTYQSPVRDLQVHGLALFMILGVSVRMMPALYDLPRPSNRRSWWAWGILVTALLSEVGFFLAYRWTNNHALAGGLVLAWALLAFGVARIILPWRPWRPFPIQDRSSKFVRAAFGWLAVSLAMLLFLPIYLVLSQVPFSHAYYGATRHAITVGFVSLMIMGMGAKVVPTLKGIAPAGLSNLWGPFALVNLGCTLRVTTQVLTDWTNHAYTILGVSGMLEVIGLTWWGVALIRIMLMDVDATPVVSINQGARPSRIEPQHIVADVLDWFPETFPVFEQHGFTALRQPLLRRTLARQVTLAQASRMKSVNIDDFLNDLNDVVKLRISPAGLLPVVLLPESGS